MSRPKRILTDDETATLRKDVEGGMSVPDAARLRGLPVAVAQTAARALKIRGKPGRALSPLRRCSMCKQRMPLEDFARNKGKSGGRDYRCRRCDTLRRLTAGAAAVGATLVVPSMSAPIQADPIKDPIIDDV